MGTHAPTSHLILAIEEALDLPKLVPALPEALRPSKPCYGPRVRAARRAARVTAPDAAAAAGISPATFSRFERGALVAGIVGALDAPVEGIRSNPVARLMGFDIAAALNAFCMSDPLDAARTLQRIGDFRPERPAFSTEPDVRS